MTATYNRQKDAKSELNRIWQHPENVNVIHYSCESFYDRTDGSSPRITSIAIRNLKTAQTVSFSIHQYGELEGLNPADLESRYNELEKKMLTGFFEFAQRNGSALWLHWNMRDVNYGFHALEHRLRVLGGNPSFIIQDDKKHD